MKVVMLRPSYKPESSGGNHLAIDLVDDLIADGYEVELIVPASDNLDNHKVEDYGYPVHRIQSLFKKDSTLNRMFRYIDTSIKMFVKLMRIKKFDLIISHSMPPTLGPLSVLAGKLLKKPVIYWEQDIVSQSIVTTGITKSGFQRNLFYTIAKSFEKITTKRSSHIITISTQFKDNHIEDGVPEDKVSVIYNWIDTEKLYPVKREENELFDKFNLDRSKFYVTYCGNLGVPQNVEIMIEAAEMLKDVNDIHFVIIGEGSRERIIKSYIKKMNLTNLSLYPLEPLEYASEVYSIGDIGLVIAKSGTSRNGFPSKTWSILSAGQVIISCFDLESELSHFITESKAGIAIEPDSPEKLKDAILDIYNMNENKTQYQKNAREYVSNNFSRATSTRKYIEIIKNVVEKDKGS